VTVPQEDRISWFADSPRRQLRHIQQLSALWGDASFRQAHRVLAAPDPHQAAAESLLGVFAASTVQALARDAVTAASCIPADATDLRTARRAFETDHPSVKNFRDVMSHPDRYKFGSALGQEDWKKANADRELPPLVWWFEGEGMDVTATIIWTDTTPHHLAVVPALMAASQLAITIQDLDPSATT